MGDERNKKKGDELDELKWNFKLLLRAAFPEGIGIDHIQAQYEEYFGKKLKFSTFKSRRFQTWEDLFTKSSVLKDTFFIRKQAGEHLVKIQKSNIGYTKEEIRRVLELSCYQEHKRRLAEKAKPVVEELKPKVIDGSAQTHMDVDTKETQTTGTETAVPAANISTTLPTSPPRLVTHLAPCSSCTPAPTQNVATVVQDDLTETEAIVSGTTPIEELYTRRSSRDTLDSNRKWKVCFLQTSTQEVRSTTRGDFGIPGTEYGRTVTSTQTNEPPSVPTKNSALEKDIHQFSPLPRNWRIPKLSSQTTTIEIDVDNSDSRISVNNPVKKRSVPDDAVNSNEGQASRQKRKKTQEHDGNGVETDLSGGSCLFPAYGSNSQSQWSPVTPLQPASNNTVLSTSTFGTNRASTSSDSSGEMDRIYSILEEWDKPVEAHISAVSSPREKSTRHGSTNKLIPSSPPRINEEILKTFEPPLTGFKTSFLWTSFNILKGLALFDQPLEELNPLEYGKSRLNGKKWCAYLVQDNESHRSVGISRGFYLSEEKKTYFLTDKGWRVTALPKLPPNSLIYGEFVNRQRGRLTDTTFHIIDVAFLDGEDISKLNVYNRRGHCKNFFETYVTPILTKVKLHQFLGHIDQLLTAMWANEKVPKFYEGSYFAKFTGIEFIAVRRGDGFGSGMDFATSMRNRYLFSLPPIRDSQAFKNLLESKFYITCF